MAIINSIAIGKASGKVGNVVFQTYKGKTYARQKNETISTEPTDNQLIQRLIMLNCTRALEYIYNFMYYFKPRNLGTLTLFAWLIQQTSQEFQSPIPLRGYLGIRKLAGKSFGIPYLIQLHTIELTLRQGIKTGVRVSFYPQIEQWEDNLSMYVMVHHINNPQSPYPTCDVSFRDLPVTLQNWIDGYIDIEFDEFDTQFVIAYCRQSYTYSGNILFSEVFD